MSVVQSKRGESEAQFIETARKLEVFTLQTVTHFPKRYTFYLSQFIFQISRSIHGHVKHANSIWPKTRHEAQTRRDEFIMARAELYDMISQVGIARDTFHINENTMTDWMKLIKHEIALVDGIMSSEEERYQDLPD